MNGAEKLMMGAVCCDLAHLIVIKIKFVWETIKSL